MGREFRPGRWSIQLDFDNKADEAAHSGLDLVKNLNMGQYDAPKQKIPSGVFHYIFYVDAQQKEHTTSRTTITYQGATYKMDVKFKSLCNSAPLALSRVTANTRGPSGRLRGSRASRSSPKSFSR